MARAGQRLIEANEELAALEVQDVGKLYSEAVSADVPSGSEAFEFAAALAMTQTGTAHRWPGALGYTERVPLGSVPVSGPGTIRPRSPAGKRGPGAGKPAMPLF